MAAPRVFYLCPDHDAPAGGLRVIYRHVDVLNGAGVEAAVLHNQPGFRCSWFDSDTRVEHLSGVVLDGGRDVLVVPEIYGPGLAGIARGVGKVVFNQNAYNTFAGYPLDLPAAPYLDCEVLAAMAVSDDNAAYLRYAFPGLRVIRTVNAIDPALFHSREPKVRRIAFMPRKNADQALQVINILKFRGALDDVEVVGLDGMSEEQVAAELRRSLIFMSTGYPEGCPTPPKEAMACGCIVVGYHGMGGRDFFTPDHGIPVPQGDVVAFAGALEEVLERHARDPETLDELAATAAAHIQATYTPERERDSVLECWDAVLAGVS